MMMCLENVEKLFFGTRSAGLSLSQRRANFYFPHRNFRRMVAVLQKLERDLEKKSAVELHTALSSLLIP